MKKIAFLIIMLFSGFSFISISSACSDTWSPGYPHPWDSEYVYEDSAEQWWGEPSWDDVGQNFVESVTEVDTDWIDWVDTTGWLGGVLSAINDWWDIGWAIDGYLSEDDSTASDTTAPVDDATSNLDWTTTNADWITKLSAEDCANPEYQWLIDMDNADPWEWICD